MNEIEVVKFLAEEVLHGKLVLSPNDETGEEYWQFKTPNGKTPYTCIRVADFDPMNDISHAFMVEDAIYEKDIAVISSYLRALITRVREETDNTETHIWSLYFMTIAFVVHASPEQRSEAAVRALATPAQIEEMGL